MILSRRSRWLWALLFVFVAVTVGTLAAGWNVVLVRDYDRILELARSLGNPLPYELSRKWRIFVMVAGSVGFAAVLGTVVLFFLRLLQEMRLNQLQSEFLAAVSHELKTPIAALELTSSLLRAGGLSESEEQKLWASHQSELKRLREEVGAILEAARWQNQPVLADRKPLQLESWLSESLPRWQKILGPDAKLKREGDPLEYEISADPKLLQLITDNLLDNARKFAKHEPKVVIRTKRAGALKRRWQITINDEGWGFDPQDSKRIFTRFFRSRNQAPYAIPGTGLGLYLASSASRALGIDIQGLSPGVGKGATFVLEGKLHHKRHP